MGPLVDDATTELPDSDAIEELDLATWSALDSLSRALHVKEADLGRTLDAILGAATRVVSEAGAASINLLVKGKFEPQAALGDAPHQLDQLQVASGVGPCVDASREQTTIRVDDFAAERRWVDYAQLALRLGVRSMLCVPLWVDDVRVGSLSLYGSSAQAFGEQAPNLAGLFATHAALALADAQRTEHLRQALINRDVIGQAKGILMERHRLTPDQAFAVLARASQDTNRKLVDVAEALTATGALPDRP